MRRPRMAPPTRPPTTAAIDIASQWQLDLWACPCQAIASTFVFGVEPVLVRAGLETNEAQPAAPSSQGAHLQSPTANEKAHESHRDASTSAGQGGCAAPSAGVGGTPRRQGRPNVHEAVRQACGAKARGAPAHKQSASPVNPGVRRVWHAFPPTPHSYRSPDPRNPHSTSS